MYKYTHTFRTGKAECTRLLSSRTIKIIWMYTRMYVRNAQRRRYIVIHGWVSAGCVCACVCVRAREIINDVAENLRWTRLHFLLLYIPGTT